jgi:hypothetical protein
VLLPIYFLEIYMKKIILLGALALAPMVVMAQTTPCTGTAGLGVAAITGDTTGTYFLRSPLTPQCSSNTIVTVDQNPTSLWGGSGSKKGKNAFLGSTKGGSVKPNAQCANTGCSATEVNAALAVAAAISGS